MTDLDHLAEDKLRHRLRDLADATPVGSADPDTVRRVPAGSIAGLPVARSLPSPRRS